MTAQQSKYFVGVDSGGTFTDVVAFDVNRGVIQTTKVSSTPSDPSQAFFDGIDQIEKRFGIRLQDIERLIFGTTVATNAILEYKGAQTGLLVTEGNRDLLEIQRQKRRRLYDLLVEKPKPLVPRRWSFGVHERVGASGEVVCALTPAEIDRVVEVVKAAGVESVAISFLFSFLHPEHELQLAEAVRKRIPGIYVSTSSDVCPEFREYERTATVVANAYVMPKIDRLASHLEQGLKDRGYDGSLRIIQSNGGLMSCEQARAYPVRTLLSGPAGGVVGAAAVGLLSEARDLITMDMGGTSLDVGVVQGSQTKLSQEGFLAGFPVKVPQLDVHTIGAGGGSLARFRRGTLRVGPESAGAVPGPVCYGRGGTEPTSTDAAVALGFVDPQYFLGGEMKLDKPAAERAIEKYIAEPLGLGLHEAAMSIVRVQVANMAKGIRAVTVEKGLDPREFTLMPFGGAGSLYAGLIAEEIGITSIIVPIQASVLSALGMLMTDIKYTRVLTRRLRSNELKPETLAAIFRDLEAHVREMFASERGDIAVRFERSCDMRYYGQGYEINVPFDVKSGKIGQKEIDELIANFHREHQRQFSHADPQDPVEVMSCRLTGLGSVPKCQLQPIEKSKGATPKPKGTRSAYFSEAKGLVDCPVFERKKLPPGSRLEGPAFVEDTDTVIVLFPDHSLTTDNYGNLLIQVPTRLSGELQ